MITITHEHSEVFLKQPTFEELEYVKHLWADEKTMKSVGGAVSMPEDKWADWYHQMVHPSDGKNFYCLIYTNENQKVGEASFYNFNDESASAYLNIKIASDHRGHGYGEHAALLILDYFFNMFGGNQMLGEVKNDHFGAKHLLEKCGFEVLSTNQEKILFGLTKDRFDALFA